MQNIPFLVIHIGSNLLYAELERIKVILLILIGNVDENEKVELRRIEPNRISSGKSRIESNRIPPLRK